MPVYQYEAIDKSGASTTGTVSAADERAALSEVRDLGLHPMGVRLATEGPAASADGGERKRRGRRIKLADLTLFTRQLANLVKGGLPMMSTIDALIENAENARLYTVLSEVRASVAGGASLHEALAEHPKEFSPLYVSLVQAGEASGELAAVLERLAGFLEQDLERRAQITAAMAYPALLISAGSLIVFVLVTFLIPKFSAMFSDYDRALPFLTQVVLGVAGFMSHYWWAVIAMLVLAVLGHRQWLRNPAGRLVWDRWRLRWPLLGRLFERAATARLARTLSTLLRGGVNILDALELMEGVVDNAYLAEGLRQVRAGVREGESLGLQTRSTGRFPGLLAQMMLVGEQTGDVDGALNTVADAFDVEVSNALKGLVALIEPLIILVMGSIVGVVIYAILIPIFQMNQGVG